MSLGRIKISPEKGTSIVDRVEFKNEWCSAEQHGLMHDGYQGDGALDIKVLPVLRTVLLSRKFTTTSYSRLA